MNKKQLTVLAKSFAKWFGLPALGYLVLFFIFNPSHLEHFSDAFYLDRGDGMQNVWNFWWVRFSIIDLGQSPYYTQYLHFPHGVTLIPQTMNIFNGLVGIPLSGLGLNLVQVVNTMVVFSFVMGGVTMFWLAHYLTKSYKAALLAGFMFTFSSYHFAHAIGHMQLISLEWVPLFLLFWVKLVQKVQYRYAAAAAGALLLVLLCDYYYFIYSVIAAVIIVGYFLLVKKLSITKQTLLTFGSFALLALLACGPLIFSLVHLNSTDELLGFHDSRVFSLDPMTLIIPGEQWYWASLTDWYNKLNDVYRAENSMYFGLALVGLLAATFFARKRLRVPADIWPWWIILAVFFILSLGPRLQMFGRTLDSVPLPYAWFEALIPTLKLSGMPIRMVFMVQLAAVVIAAFAVRRISFTHKKTRNLSVGLFAAICIVAFLDVYPQPEPLSPSRTFPPYAYALQKLPLAKGSGIIDHAAVNPYEALYAQTLHRKPEAFGYMTRTPRSVEDKTFHVFAALEQGRHHDLCTQYHIRYLATDKIYANGYPVVFQDTKHKVRIYDLKNSDDC